MIVIKSHVIIKIIFTCPNELFLLIICQSHRIGNIKFHTSHTIMTHLLLHYFIYNFSVIWYVYFSIIVISIKE